MPCTAALSTDTDEQLIARVAAGDARAFELIYDRHRNRAYSLARRIAGTGAEEATQEAFLTAWRMADRFDPDRASFATWLMTLVRYRCIDSARRSGLRAARGTDTALELLEEPERTDELVIVDQAREEARRLLQALPPEQRVVIELAYFAGYTQQEIAARTGLPLGTVKGRARLALAKLRHAADREPALARA